MNAELESRIRDLEDEIKREETERLLKFWLKWANF